MLNLIFAPNAELLVSLASKLIKKIWNDPFEPPTIIVPNPAIGKWLCVRLAQGQPQNLSKDHKTTGGLGCIANARLVTLEKFLWNALEPPTNAHLLETNQLSQIIEALLNETLLRENIYKPLRNYLCRGDNINKIDSLKRVQLSAIIAALFLEYEYNRPSVWSENAMQWGRHGIDAHWLLGKNYFQNFEHEPWQKDLYQKVFNCFGKSDERIAVTLPHLYRKKREICGKEKRLWCSPGSQIILFNVSKISHFHRNTLVEISQMDGVETHLFLTNPCAEFWEDVDTSRKRTSRVRWSYNSPDETAAIKPLRPDDYDKPELNLFEDSEDHTLLKLWGSAGKENIYLWCPQAEWNFEYHCPTLDSDAEPKTLLQSLQKSLLTRQDNLCIKDGVMKDDDMKNDRSLQILACPDKSREVEELRELVLDMVHNKKIDKFDDIAVYIPDVSAYQSHILRVFGAYSQNDPQYIPFTILNASGASSLVNQGMCSLLNIIGGKFNRPQIFALLRNPVVQASQNFSSYMVNTWEKWAQDLGMYRGLNASGRKRMGDMGEAVTDIHTFKYGLSRLSIANSAAEPVNMGFIGGSGGEPLLTYPYHRELTEYETRALEIFSGLLEELDTLSNDFNRNCSLLNIREAVELIKKAVWRWFGTIPNNEHVRGGEEEKIRQELLDGIEHITFQHTLAKRENIPVDEFTALVQTCLPQELPTSSSSWNGITFAPLKQSLIAPHKVIFAIGLDASAFPGTNEKGSWDLLSQKRIVGDSDRVKENRFAFLELIHAAKESLILSYKARDMQKDELLQPSSVILELEDFLINQGASEVKEGETRCSIRREIPWVVHESLDIPILTGREHGTWDKTEYELATLNSNTRIHHRHDTQSNASVLPVNKPLMPLIKDENKAALNRNNMTTDINDIKRFFSNPLEYHLYRTLGIGPDDNREDMSQGDEPLVSGYYLAKLRKNLWSAVLELLFPAEESKIINEPQTLERRAAKIAGKIYDTHIISGKAPEGYLCRMEREELIKWSKPCVEAAIELLSIFTAHKLVKECGFSLCRENIPCFLTITDKNERSFSINGSHSLALIPKEPQNAAAGAAIIAFNKDGNIADNHELWLEGVIQYIYEEESADKLPLSLIQLSHNKPDVQRFQMKFTPQKSDEIKKWLAVILEQMLIENRCEHLPFKVIQKIVKPDKKGHCDLNERLSELNINTFKDELMNGKTYKCYMDSFNLTDAKPPQLTDIELRELAALRFAPILDGGLTDE